MSAVEGAALLPTILSTSTAWNTAEQKVLIQLLVCALPICCDILCMSFLYIYLSWPLCWFLRRVFLCIWYLLANESMRKREKVWMCLFTLQCIFSLSCFPCHVPLLQHGLIMVSLQLGGSKQNMLSLISEHSTALFPTWEASVFLSFLSALPLTACHWYLNNRLSCCKCHRS